MKDNEVITAIAEKLEQLAKEGLLAQSGYHPLDVVVRDKTDQLQVHTFPGGDADDVVTYLKQYLQTEGSGSREVYLTLDCVAEENQGTTLHDVLVIIHCQLGRGFRVGIIEYETTSNPLQKKAVTWNNLYWQHNLKNLGTELYALLMD